MYGNANTINNNSSIWAGKTGTHGEWNETELEGELETLSGKLKSLWNRNKGRAQNLAKIGIDLMDILGTLANPLPPNDPSARTKRNQDAYASNQTMEQKRQLSQATNKNNKKPPISGNKELENNFLGEILNKNFENESINPEYEMALLTGEINSVYDKIKDTQGRQSILAEVLMEMLEAESYDILKAKNWATIVNDLKKNNQKINGVKNISRLVSGKLHFSKPEIYQPTGVEVHHWIPFKYAHLFPEFNLEQLNKLTVPLDSFAHALIGAAIDKAAGKNPAKPAIEKVLNKLSSANWKSGNIQLNPAYFNSVSDVQFLPSPKLTRNKKIGVIRNITNFKTHFNLPRELEFEAVNLN